MQGSKITGLVSNTVTLGGQGYPSPLTITSTGMVMPSVYGADAVFSSTAGVVLHNHGIVQGGAGHGDTVNGAGVDFTAYGTVTNSGSISAGSGGPDTTGAGIILHAGGVVGNTGMIYGGGSGGIGVDILGGGQLSNSGSIVGGTGLSRYVGGAAVYAQDVAIRNTGLLKGGYPTKFGEFGGGYTGGIGVDLSGGSLSNAGTIIGGNGSYNLYGGGGGSGGAGLAVMAAAKITNSGTITGGQGGSAGDGGRGAGGSGIDITASATIVNHGVIAGGLSGQTSSFDSQLTAASGIIGGSAVITNFGTIAGAATGNGLAADETSPPASRGQVGGAAIALVSASIVNHGGITGGDADNGGGQLSTGGDGIDLSASGTITNLGTIAGGYGGYLSATNHAAAASGGNGIMLAGGVVTNSGVIAGGTGGQAKDSAAGGTGGVGILLSGSAVLTNSGDISGGAGGASQGWQGGDGGIGVSLDGGTLTNTGTISGGAGGSGQHGAGAQGAAVQFGALAGTLIIDAGAVFNGVVAANADVDDTLRLVGAQAGTITGLGTAFAGFTTVVESAGATWVVSGDNTLAAGSGLYVRGALTVQGSLLDAGAANVSGGATLGIAGTAIAQFGSLGISGGAVTLAGGAELVVGTSLSGEMAGEILIQSGATLTGFGAVGDAAASGITDDGTIVAAGGVLTLDNAVNGAGIAAIDDGATLSLQDSFGAAGLSFGSGVHQTLVIAADADVTASLSGFGKHDVIDEKQIITSVSYTGGTLSLLDGQSVVGTLFLAGNYNAGDFHVGSDGQGGTDITYGAQDLDWAAPAPVLGQYGHAAGPGLAWAGHDGDLPGLAGWVFHTLQ